MQKYHLEFILHIYPALRNAPPSFRTRCGVYDTSVQMLRGPLAEFGQELEITELSEGNAGAKGRDFKININTEEPTAVFDTCSQFGRIRAVKVEERGRQDG